MVVDSRDLSNNAMNFLDDLHHFKSGITSKPTYLHTYFHHEYVWTNIKCSTSSKEYATTALFEALNGIQIVGMKSTMGVIIGAYLIPSTMLKLHYILEEGRNDIKWLRASRTIK